jgi:hypothetical protein
MSICRNLNNVQLPRDGSGIVEFVTWTVIIALVKHQMIPLAHRTLAA